MVKEEEVPEGLQIEKYLPKIDFSDTFSTTNHTDHLKLVAFKIFGQAPPAVKFLFAVRNFVVKYIGLKTSMPPDYNSDFKVGGYIGFFQIYHIRQDEVVLGANDTHLDFRVSIFNSHEKYYNIKVTTIVQFNNATGKVYMFIVKPFHRLVVKQLVKNAYLKAVN